QCGGNVGDTCDIPIQDWDFKKHAELTGRQPDDLKYRSEQGNISLEVLSAWATHLVVSEYKDLYAAFSLHFENHASRVREINISLGPAGELRYPSYNRHDKGTDYPTRGAVQAFSRLAAESWARYAKERGIEERLPMPVRFQDAAFAHSSIG